MFLIPTTHLPMLNRRLNHVLKFKLILRKTRTARMKLLTTLGHTNFGTMSGIYILKSLSC